MASNPNRISFPKPVNKRSHYERQRADAEAKRQREAAETAAVYEDFVKSFDDGNSTGPDYATAATAAVSTPAPSRSRPTLPASMAIGSAGGRRHFSMPSAKPGGGPPPARHGGSGGTGGGAGSAAGSGRLVSNRLAFGGDSDSEDEGPSDRRPTAPGLVAGPGPRVATAANRAADRAFSKPTLRLANMPPNMSPAAVRALVASAGLVVDGVQMLHGTAAVTTTATSTRKSAAAIVTLAAETPGAAIDAVVSSLKDHYLGYGYTLSLHRYLSSAVAASASTTAVAPPTGPASSGRLAGPQPFGAKLVSETTGGNAAMHSSGSMGYAPPPASAFARSSNSRNYGVPPPASYAGPDSSSGGVGRGSIYHVPVEAPTDIRALRAIHQVIEGILSEGPAFEALLMSRPEVQREKRWAWLWDAHSQEGIWYRYRLWQMYTGHKTRRGQTRYVPVFEGSHAWRDPAAPLPYEFITDIAEFVSDSEFGRSSDDSDDEGPEPAAAGASAAGGAAGKDGFLNPLQKARLAHLLARLPTTLGKIRKGDIARVTAFAITHAARGGPEIVEMVVANIVHPFAWAAAAHPDPTGNDKVPVPVPVPSDNAGEAQRDPSGAKLIGIYVANDILSASSSSARRSWRYRNLFADALRKHSVFEGLGLLAEKLNWGRLRADKWKRSVNLVLSQWEGWSIFSPDNQEYFVSTFENPPSAVRDKAAAAAGETGEAGAAGAAMKKSSRWKTVDTAAKSVEASGSQTDLDGRSDRDKDGDDGTYRSDYTDNEELDLACLRREDIDGWPMSDMEVDGTRLTSEEVEALVGGRMAEMSEEGEVGTDDGDEDMMDMNELTDGSSGGEMGDVAMGPVPAKKEKEKQKETSDKSEKSEKSEEVGESAKTEKAESAQREAKAETRTVAGFQVPVSSGTILPRKRMRAVDMFADSDSE